MRGLVIREGSRTDGAALERLIKQIGFEASGGNISDRLETMDSTGNRLFVAEHGGDIIGCLTTSIMEVVHRPAPVGRISMMVVDEALRGQGVGRALVMAAQNHLARCGCHLVEVTSRFDLVDAHSFYQKLGYEKTSVRLARALPSMRPSSDGI